MPSGIYNREGKVPWNKLPIEIRICKYGRDKTTKKGIFTMKLLDIGVSRFSQEMGSVQVICTLKDTYKNEDRKKP